MQSQQKRVKWSRGETAEALEERTDTGITQASVELMENCIPDIFGNISRRPALKLIPLASGFTTPNGVGLGFPIGNTLVEYSNDKYQFIPFYISETDIILIGVNTGKAIRIKDGHLVYENDCGLSATGKVSYAQQNNYLIVADERDIKKVQFTLASPGYGFTPEIERWRFTAGWYAPNGTQTRTIATNNVTGLNFHGGFSNYAYSDKTTSTIYSIINTGVSFSDKTTLEEMIPVGSIIKMPDIGCYFRIEGYTYGQENSVMAFDLQFDGVLNRSDAIPSTGTYCKINRTENDLPIVGHTTVDKLVVYIDGELQSGYRPVGGLGQENGTRYIVLNTASGTGLSATTITNGYTHVSTPGGGMDIQNSATLSNWSNLASSTVYAYGSLLTPVANENGSDSTVSVEFGYENLTPDFNTTGLLVPLSPHPTKVLFSEQRLWTADWATTTDNYSIVIGSQIARYNDLKNDYNQENEPITLDILTKFKEKIIHLIDYNGLKIMTDSYEYAYQNGGVVKQSGNGSLEFCDPIVFDSLCLYADATGSQIKAMQYEFQSNIFNSSSINTTAPADLVWFPKYLATHEDKEYSTGKYLFVVNTESSSRPILTVCNFVPGNQANIWNRWSFPNFTPSSDYDLSRNMIHSVLNTKGKPIFMVYASRYLSGDPASFPSNRIIMPAYLDFEENVDCVGTVTNNNYIIAQYTDTYYSTTYYITLPNISVAVYADGVFQWLDTTNSQGKLTKDTSALTNVTVGLPINSTIRSHPIDVGGKTKSVMKRIGKTQVSVHDTAPGAITVNGKTGYMNPRTDHICFYGVTGMKDEIKYTITNNNGAMFHLESLLMNIEYGTLDS